MPEFEITLRFRQKSLYGPDEIADVVGGWAAPAVGTDNLLAIEVEPVKPAEAPGAVDKGLVW